MRGTLFLAAVCLLFGFTSGVHGQSDDPGSQPTDQGSDQPDWIQSTNEEPQPTDDWVRPSDDVLPQSSIAPQALTALRAEAFGLDLDSKIRVLSTIRMMHEEGGLDANDRPGIDILSFLATESYDFEVRRDGRVMNDFPMVRAEAVILLGSVGGPIATSTLQRVLTHESDTYVLAQAVTAVARSTTEPTPELLSTLTLLVNRMNVVRRPDNSLAMAVVNAVEEMNERSAGIDDPDLFRALLSIAQGGYSSSVRRAAVRVIDQLRQRVR